MGKISKADFIRDYATALRITDLAVRKYHSKIRVYVSMDHHWNSLVTNDPLKEITGPDVLEGLNDTVRSEGDFPWNVAFHPYPENLFEPRFWNDRQTLSYDTPKVTFKNLEVLPAFLKQGRFLYKGKSRRIILSEQGFHAVDSPEGEKIQAAAFAYAYYKISHMPSIDAFMYFRHVSASNQDGLRLGLWSWDPNGPTGFEPGRPMYIYDVFRLADTDKWREAFEFAKPIIGITDWSQALPSNKPIAPKRQWFDPSLLVFDLCAHLHDATVLRCLDWRPEFVEIDGHMCPSIFQHPPAKGYGDATYTIKLPSPKPGHKLIMRFGTAFTAQTDDGVRFCVLANGVEKWAAIQRTVPPVNHVIDLSDMSGQTIALTLRVDSLKNPIRDWANWVCPIIEYDRR
jgi:hypothetical protein